MDKLKLSVAGIGLLCLVLYAGNIPAQNILNVKNFGARGNGRSDDTRAIQKTIDAASRMDGATVYFPKGTFLLKSYTTTNNFLENYILSIKSNIKIKGAGMGSVIKLGSNLFNRTNQSANAHLFSGYNISNVTFSDLLIDLNGPKNLVPKGGMKTYAAIFVKSGSGLLVNNVTMQNSAGRTMMNIMGKGRGLIIENSRFLNGGPYPGSNKSNPYQDDFSFLYSEWDSTTIRNNTICQENLKIANSHYCAGIELHGSNSAAINNSITGCWPGIFISSTNGQVQENVSVRDNDFIKCVTGISFWLVDTMRNITISSNSINLTGPTNQKFQQLTVWGIVTPNGNSVQYNRELANAAPIIDLKIDSNKISADSMSNSSGGISIHSVANSQVTANKFSGMNYSGISISGSKWGIRDLTIERNDFENFRKNNHPTRVGGYFVITDTYSPSQKDPPGFKKIKIANNSVVGSSIPDNEKNNNFKGGFIALPSGMMKAIELDNNQNSKSLINFYKVITNH